MPVLTSKIKLGSLVCLKWVDATSQEGQLSKNEVLALPLPEVSTCGFLMADNIDKVIVSGEILHEAGKEPTYRSTTAVPRGMVKSMVKLVEWKES